MQLSVKDGNGQAQIIVAPGVESPTDVSGTIAATNESQVFADADVDRAGFFFQNVADNAMTINELGADATAGASWVINPGAFFPPPGFPVTTSPLTVAGTAGDAFVARTWSNAAS